MVQYLTKIYTLGIQEDFHPEDKSRAILINQILFFSTLLVFSLIPFVYLFAEWINVIVTFWSGIIVMLPLFFSYRGKHDFALLYFVFSSSILVAITSIIIHNSHSDTFFLLIAIIPFLIRKNEKSNFIMLFFIMLLFCGVNIVNEYIEPIAVYNESQKKFAYLSNIMAITFVMTIFLIKLKQKNERFETDLIHQKKIKDKMNQEVLDSINYAKRIQSAILPSIDFVNKCLEKSFILYKPKDIVAGDFYWFNQINNKILFAAADCTGHGVPGAMLSVVCNNGLNRAIKEFNLTDPGKILNKTSEIVAQEFEKTIDEKINDGMDIALCSLEGNMLEYAGAYIPLWIVRNGKILVTPANKQPIGKLENFLPYTTHAIKLEKGDTFYIFSDGFPDQYGGEKGKKYKFRRLEEFLLAIQNFTMEQQKKLLENEFEDWKLNIEQTDDVCIIGVRV